MKKARGVRFALPARPCAASAWLLSFYRANYRQEAKRALRAALCVLWGLSLIGGEKFGFVWFPAGVPADPAAGQEDKKTGLPLWVALLIGRRSDPALFCL